MCWSRECCFSGNFAYVLNERYLTIISWLFFRSFKTCHSFGVGVKFAYLLGFFIDNFISCCFNECFYSVVYIFRQPLFIWWGFKNMFPRFIFIWNDYLQMCKKVNSTVKLYKSWLKKAMLYLVTSVIGPSTDGPLSICVLYCNIRVDYFSILVARKCHIWPRPQMSRQKPRVELKWAGRCCLSIVTLECISSAKRFPTKIVNLFICTLFNVTIYNLQMLL